MGSRARRSVGAVLAACAMIQLGCGDDGASPAAAASSSSSSSSGGGGGQVVGCAPGERPVGEACIPAGEGAGIAPEDCPEGFLPDGAAGCDPILPDAPCGNGAMAVPGESECHPVGTCGAGTWGDVPIDASTQHVDASYSQADSDGSAAKPWTSIGTAIAAAAPGATVAIAAGSYAESLSIDKPLVLWGRCPDQVEIAGAANEPVVHAVADGVEIRGVALTGGAVGVLAPADGLVVDTVWIHDTPNAAIWIEKTATVHDVLLERTAGDALVVYGGDVTAANLVARESQRFGVVVGPVGSVRGRATLDAAFIDRNTRSGVLVEASDATFTRTVIRDTQPGAPDYGFGIQVQLDDATLEQGDVHLDGCSIDNNVVFGINVGGSRATIERTMVRDTAPGSTGGRGIQVRYNSVTGTPGEATIRHSVLDRNTSAAIAVTGATAEIDSVIVRDTLPGPGAPEPLSYGHGLSAFASADVDAHTSVTVRSSVFERNTEVGLSAIGADVVVEGTVIKDTLPNPDNGIFGRGVAVQDAPSLQVAAKAELRWSVVEGNREASIYAGGDATLAVEGVLVRGTLPDAGGYHGWGITAYGDEANGTAPTVDVTSSLVEGSVEAGAVAQGGTLRLATTAIRGSSPNADGQFGDGVVVAPSAVPTLVIIDSCEIADSARAGLSVFSGQVTLLGTRMECNAIHLNAESFFGGTFSLDDAGGNVCGCDGETVPCKVLSTGLAPPEPL